MGASNGEGRTELDSHANMCVLGKYCLLLFELATARKVSVGAFAEAAGGLESVQIVDAMLVYDCPRRNQVYLLILRNLLYIETIQDHDTRLFITMQIRSAFSYFPTRKPLDEAFEDGLVVVITPKRSS